MSSRLASVVYAVMIGTCGALHLINAGELRLLLPSFLPAGVVWIYLSGFALIGAAIAIVSNNELSRPVCYLLAVMIFLFIFLVQLRKASFSPDNMKLTYLEEMFKDAAIAMGAVIIGNFKRAKSSAS
jgi:putative oxidoreductase